MCTAKFGFTSRFTRLAASCAGSYDFSYRNSSACPHWADHRMRDTASEATSHRSLHSGTILDWFAMTSVQRLLHARWVRLAPLFFVVMAPASWVPPWRKPA